MERAGLARSFYTPYTQKSYLLSAIGVEEGFVVPEWGTISMRPMEIWSILTLRIRMKLRTWRWQTFMCPEESAKEQH